MKIAISGKGGAGKTTISATLARLFAQRGMDVLAIDGDPNPNLSVALGLAETERSRLGPLPRNLLEDRVDEEGNRQRVLNQPVATIMEQHAVPGPDNITLMLGCRVDHAGAG